MAITDEREQQLAVLKDTLAEMKDYLRQLAEGCEKLPTAFHTTNKGRGLADLSQVVDGLSYYPKLLQSATVLLGIDVTEEIWEKTSVASFVADLSRIFTDIDQAVESEDYSVLADLVEYDLLPAVYTAKELLNVMQPCNAEGIV